MKSISAVFSKVGFAAFVFTVCLGTAHGQSGNPYDTGMDNPRLSRKSPTPGPSAAAAPKQAAKGASSKDQKFFADAGSSFGWEMKTGAVAEKKAQDAKTKEVAGRLVSSYSKLAKELTDLGAKKGVSLSVEGAKAQQLSDYDKSYLRLSQQDQQQLVSVFRKASQSAEDPDVRAWAKRTLPTLQQNAASAK